jgi:predicted XRE-type DNA-binding protein
LIDISLQNGIKKQSTHFLAVLLVTQVTQPQVSEVMDDKRKIKRLSKGEMLLIMM